MKRSPIKVKTHRYCEYSECRKEFKKRKTTDKYCSSKCEVADKGYPEKKKPTAIPQVSNKQKIVNAKYTVLRIEFLGKPENQICFIDGCGKKATTIEHRMGRKGFADDWARQNDIPLTIDIRFFAPCCAEHNFELENNPELSKEYQLSKIHGGKKQ